MLAACSAADDPARSATPTTAAAVTTSTGPPTSTGYTIPEHVDRDFDEFLDAEPGYESFCTLFTDIANPINYADPPRHEIGGGGSYDASESDPLFEWRIEDEHRRAREARAFGAAAIALAPDAIRDDVEAWAVLAERHAAAYAVAWEEWLRTGEGELPRRNATVVPSSGKGYGDLMASLFGLCQDLS